MTRTFQQIIGWLTTISIVTAGLLFSVHVHGSDGCAICQCSQQEIGCEQHAEGAPGESADLPFLPPHDSNDCAICHFSGDLGDLLPVTVNEHAAELAGLVPNRPVSLNLFHAALAYQGRAPPQTFFL